MVIVLQKPMFNIDCAFLVVMRTISLECGLSVAQNNVVLHKPRCDHIVKFLRVELSVLTDSLLGLCCVK